MLRPMAPAKQEKAHEILLKWLINKNLPFFVIDDTFFRLFVENLSATYNPPSADMISNRILTASFAKHLEAKLKKHAKIRDLTICLDGWTDGFGYFIYGFMALWQEIEHVLEINDLSAQRHNADFRKQELVEVLKLNGINTSSVIACVTDNPSVMVKMRNDLKADFPNIIPIRCCLHAFNLLIKDITAFPSLLVTCKSNQQLVNFFLSSHIWQNVLQQCNQQACKEIFGPCLLHCAVPSPVAQAPRSVKEGALKYEFKARIANMKVHKAGGQEKGHNALTPTIEGAGLDVFYQDFDEDLRLELMMAEELEPLLQANENEPEEDSMEEYFVIGDVERDQTENEGDEVEEDA
ncbi:hypothetical protein MPTK1_5g18930 [Marchantia polymorpha subsp. ruderalis]|uniref:DUF659 domain-containing protein n=1 Tax=Marchantia polymorpha subsp. ruderalis TaxID=1480154 RepID=A0AAF6BJW7_MARPO|nr:hypothetical protein Mp_5g18930 [Marchantia polymorpha subsp. ruderalis]